MAHNNEGSERLSGDPVILTFALSKEEWAKVAASLTFLVEQADLITQSATHGFFIILAQIGHVAGLVRGMQVTVF